MKAPISWLKDYVNIKMPAADLAEFLTMSGIHVDFAEKIGADFSIEFEITSNRSDCLSVIGIAREIAAITGEKLKLPKGLMSNVKCQMSNKSSMSNVKIKIQIVDKKLCTRYTARVIRGVKVAPSPKWLEDRLISVGTRPVNNIVDITNFVLMETGQPMHAFDLDKIKGNIAVRRAKKGEKITSIDAVSRSLGEGTLVIADDSAPIAIAGVMGGLDTEVSDATKNILLESAFFDPVSVRKTSRLLGLASESSYRFERRVDNSMVLPASNRGVALIKELAGGQINELIDLGQKTFKERRVKYDPEKANLLLGVSVSAKEQKAILAALEFSVKGEGRKLIVKIPEFRKDISREIDITEEIARIYGYDKVPMTIPRIIGNMTLMDKNTRVKKEIRGCLALMGLNEIVTHNLISADILKGFLTNEEEMACVKNPLSKEQDTLAQSLLPGMLKVVNWNINRKNKDLALFEIANIYKRAAKKKFSEELSLSACMTGLAEDNWLSGRRKATFFDLKGVITNLFNELGISGFEFITADDIPYFSAASLIKYSGKNIGSIGKFDQAILKKFDIDEEIYGLHISLEEIIRDAVLEKKFKPIPKFPSITRDISLIAGKDISAEAIVSAIREVSRDIVRDIALIDRYSGKQIPDGKQGLLYRIEYRDDTKTLTDSEVDEQHNKIRANLASKLGISFR